MTTTPSTASFRQSCCRSRASRRPTAPDAESAHAQLLLRIPDLILMDIALPGMDGLALTRIIKADARLHRVPVIALTAYAMKGDDRTAREAGCDAYITKPIDTRRLPEQVGSVLWAAQITAAPCVPR